jgi:TIR domain-containing protein
MAAHAWESGYFRLFISHISGRKDLATTLRDGLRRHHVDAFVAHEDIAPTAAWLDEIEDALATCDACIAVLSDGFKASDWCDQEVGICVGRGLVVLAVHDGLAPYGFIGKFQAFSPRRYQDDDALCDALFAALRDNESSRRRMAEALVNAFEESPNFAAVVSNVDALKDIPREAWTDELLDRVEQAHENNRQISDANHRYHGPKVSVVAARLVQSIRATPVPTTARAEADEHAELLTAALELRENIEELRRRVARAIPTGVYWRDLLVWNVFETHRQLLLRRAPKVFEPVSAAYLWLRELNEDVPLGDPIPPDKVAGLRDGVDQLQHASQTLGTLVGELQTT